MNFLQLKASDPEISTWVSASAGTGKTKILTDRVLRLLLQDVQFSKILCLTFTNVAASEMQERIISQLEQWSKYSKEDLLNSLKNTIGKEPTSQDLSKAKLLFDSYLKSQNQINIHTIHSFCQKILKQFPVEAKIAPNFKVIDEFKVIEIIKKIKRKIFHLPEFTHIIRFFAENFHELTIDEIFNDIISLKTSFLDKKIDSESVAELSDKSLEIVSKLSKHHEFVATLEIPLDFKVKHYLSKDEGDIDFTMSSLKSLFLTLEGDKKKRIFSKATKDSDPDLAIKLEEVQDVIYQLDQKYKAEYMILYSELFDLVAEKLISEYELYKKQNALLDYDDLIIYTKNLLTNSHSKEWVLYKLDGGIEHLLVDEAQDTSKNQWHIIEALVEEFYSGESVNRENRTIFIVGDEKQSIFSFQGADITFFSHMNQLLNKRLSDGQRPFATVDLDISYRSTKEILTVVEDVFSRITKNSFEHFSAKLLKMISYRNDDCGMVELWPLVTDQNAKDTQDSFWSIDNEKTDNSKIILAEKIASYVKEQLNSSRILPSTQAPISASDFLILFRKRDDFTDEVIKALKKAEIDIIGLDRMLLAESLGVFDLLSIAKFVLNPENDLNLSALLKSPIFEVQEEELQNLVILARDKQISIWEYLKLYTSDNSRFGASNFGVRVCSRTQVRSARSPLVFLPTLELSEVYSNENYEQINHSLSEFIHLYENFPLTDFFLYISDVFNYRSKLIDYAEDIDEFLKLSRNYFLEIENSLQSFIYWFEENQIFVKRGANAKNKLRIMTTHGSKGLQAPIVILCDTTKIPNSNERFIWDECGKLLSVKSSNYAPEFYKTLKNQQQQKAYQEYLRLLYVGMTRAKDQLIVCGYQTNSKIAENCWYELVRSSMKELGTVDDNQVLYFGKIEDSKSKPFDEASELKHSKEQVLLHHEIILTSSKDIVLDALNVSKNTEEAASKALWKSYVNNSLEYGSVFHKILEDSISGKDLSKAYEHPLIATLNKKIQERIKVSLDKIISNGEFIKLLEYSFKTELSFGYKDLSGTKIGRVDLLVIKDDEVIIVDYKSDNLNSSLSNNVASTKYLEQLSFYKKAFSEIYKDKNIVCKLLWLENGVLQDVL